MIPWDDADGDFFDLHCQPKFLKVLFGNSDRANAIRPYVIRGEHLSLDCKIYRSLCLFWLRSD